MKILSIDVGIKNLAFCLFVKSENNIHFTIKKWDIVNIAEQHTYKCCFTSKNKICNSEAKYKKNNLFFCLKHSKKHEFLIPTNELKPTFLNKQKLQKLHEIANKYNITHDNPIKKVDLLSLINEYIHNTCFEEIKNTNASNVDLINIGINIMHKFNDLFNEEDSIDYVIIENQISPIANRMKTIQGMIVQYFIMSKINVDNIEFISAANKLKDCIPKEKTNYTERKKLGIAHCLEILQTNIHFNERIDFFNNHKKKDDLADSFLQGMWFIKNKIANNIINENKKQD